LSERNQELQILLDRAGVIKERYQQVNMDNEFNIFSILRKEHDEVGLHSRFICELLNPKGVHYQEDKFLKLFLDHIGMEYDENDLINYKVEREYRINKSQNNDQYNNLDILISYGDEAYILENKIYEEERIEQLDCYYQAIKNKFKNRKVILLTLFDHQLEENKIDVIPREDFIQITYEKNIVEWLSACIKETAQKPLLREALVMYKNLVLKLTGQSYSEGMVKEMKDLIIESRKNFEIVLDIEKSLPEAKARIQELFWGELESALDKFGHNKVQDDENWSKDLIKDFYYKSRGVPEYGLSYSTAKPNQFDIRLWISITKYKMEYSFTIYDEKNKIVKNDDERTKSEEVLWNKVIESVEEHLPSYINQNEWCPRFKDSSKDIKFMSFDTDDMKSLIEDESRKQVISEIAEEVKNDIEKFREVFN